MVRLPAGVLIFSLYAFWQPATLMAEVNVNYRPLGKYRVAKASAQIASAVESSSNIENKSPSKENPTISLEQKKETAVAKSFTVSSVSLGLVKLGKYNSEQYASGTSLKHCVGFPDTDIKGISVSQNIRFNRGLLLIWVKGEMTGDSFLLGTSCKNVVAIRFPLLVSFSKIIESASHHLDKRQMISTFDPVVVNTETEDQLSYRSASAQINISVQKLGAGVSSASRVISDVGRNGTSIYKSVDQINSGFEELK